MGREMPPHTRQWRALALVPPVAGSDQELSAGHKPLGKISVLWKAFELREPWCCLCLKIPGIILWLTASPNTPVIGLLVLTAPADRTRQPWQPGAAPGWQCEPLSCSFSPTRLKDMTDLCKHFNRNMGSFCRDILRNFFSLLKDSGLVKTHLFTRCSH